MDGISQEPGRSKALVRAIHSAALAAANTSAVQQVLHLGVETGDLGDL